MSPLIVMAALACSNSTEHTGTEQADTKEPVISELQWVLDWDLDGITVHENGSWSTLSNRGYSVTIDDGWLITSAVSLVPCDLEADTGVLAFLGALWGHAALASHAPFSDPSMLELSAKEPLTPPTSVSLNTLSLSEAKYCSSYWLIARGGPNTDAEHTSVSMTGTWSKGDQSGPIQITTDFARAHLRDLPLTPADRQSFRAILTRQPAHAFDDINFVDDNDYAIAWQVVKNFTEQVEFRLD